MTAGILVAARMESQVNAVRAIDIALDPAKPKPTFL
jgi:hypothetical protein